MKSPFKTKGSTTTHSKTLTHYDETFLETLSKEELFDLCKSAPNRQARSLAKKVYRKLYD